MRRLAILLTLAATTAVLPAVTAGAAVEPPPDYGDPAIWLCRPDVDDVCDEPLTTTFVAPDGRTRERTARVAKRPAADCFYVYPTVSTDPTPSSDLVPNEAERGAARSQLAPFGQVCRVFAPVYRQNTLAGLFGDQPGWPSRAERAELAYSDVLAAWRHYLAEDNGDRPVVLIGHSQGAGILNRLLREEIEAKPAQHRRLASALLLGSTVRVPPGAVVGGDFARTPLCERRGQTRCVITYATFRDTAPPPPNSFFGRPRTGEGVAGCTNPARLRGGGAWLDPRFPSSFAPAWGPGVDRPQPATAYVSFPRFLHARCVERDGFSYLEVRVAGDPADPRTDDIPGDLTPEWGLHLVDASVAMGDLVDLVRVQARAAVRR